MKRFFLKKKLNMSGPVVHIKKGLEVKVDISRWTVVEHCVEIGHAKAQQSSAKHVSQS